MTTTTILTRRRGGPHGATHWAVIEGEPGTIGSGPTAAAAIGALVRQLPGRFGVVIRELDVIPDRTDWKPPHDTDEPTDAEVEELKAELAADTERRRARAEAELTCKCGHPRGRHAVHPSFPGYNPCCTARHCPCCDFTPTPAAVLGAILDDADRRARLDGVIAEAAATTDGIMAELEAAKEKERAEYEEGCRTVMLRPLPAPRRSFERGPDALAMEFDDDLFTEDDPLARTQLDMAPSPVLVEVMADMARDEEMAALNGRAAS